MSTICQIYRKFIICSWGSDFPTPSFAHFVQMPVIILYETPLQYAERIFNHAILISCSHSHSLGLEHTWSGQNNFTSLQHFTCDILLPLATSAARALHRLPNKQHNWIYLQSKQSETSLSCLVSGGCKLRNVHCTVERDYTMYIFGLASLTCMHAPLHLIH